MTELVDYLENGNIVSKSVNLERIKVSSIGYNAPERVILDDMDGFLKRSSATTETLDKFEFLISKLGKMLNVKTADTYLVIDNGENYTFSKNVAPGNQKLVMSSEINEYIISNGLVSEDEIKEYQDFKERLTKIDKDHHNMPMCESLEDIEYAINIFGVILSKLNLENEEDILKDYYKMCFFDAITGNKDRNINNFGLVQKEDGFEFAPLFDSATVDMPNIPTDLVQINGFLINREILCTYLIDNYPNYLSDILNVDLDSVHEKLENISKKILNEHELEWFNSSVLNKVKNNKINNIKNK